VQFSVPHDELIPLPQRGITLEGGGGGEAHGASDTPPCAHPRPDIPCRLWFALWRKWSSVLELDSGGGRAYTHNAMQTLSSPTFFDSPTATLVMCCSAVNMVNHRLPTLENLRPARAFAPAPCDGRIDRRSPPSHVTTQPVRRADAMRARGRTWKRAARRPCPSRCGADLMTLPRLFFKHRVFPFFDVHCFVVRRNLRTLRCL
jgi:hypothetical protein